MPLPNELFPSPAIRLMHSSDVILKDHILVDATFTISAGRAVSHASRRSDGSSTHAAFNFSDFESQITRAYQPIYHFIAAESFTATVTSRRTVGPIIVPFHASIASHRNHRLVFRVASGA